MIRKILLKIVRIWKSIPADRMYLVLLLMAGCICLTVTGGWHYYTDPIKEGGSMLMSKIGIEWPKEEEKPEAEEAAGEDEKEEDEE